VKFKKGQIYYSEQLEELFLVEKIYPRTDMTKFVHQADIPASLIRIGELIYIGEL